MGKPILLMLTGCLVAGMGNACSRGVLHNTGPGSSPHPSTLAPEAEHAGAISGAADDCTTTGCGSNGPALEDNLRFRTLHLSPDKENEAHLSIVDFRDSAGNPLTIDVQGDLLMGTNQRTHQVLTGVDLAGAQLFLSHSGSKSAHKKAKYVLTIEKVHNTDYWMGCRGCDGAKNQFPVYEFLVSANDGPKTKLCVPAPGKHALTTGDGSDASNIHGDAVIFRGDFYDDETHTVSTDVTPENADLFNFTCFGTAIAKLHFLRHTSASQVSPDDPRNPTVQDRQTLLRLITADYCGDGSSFTEEGMPLKFAFHSLIYSLAGDGTEYNIGDAESIDALWTPNGAMCIGTPRLRRSRDPRWHDLTVDKIRKMCRKRAKKTDLPAPALEDCSTLTDVRSNLFANGNYAISGNPK